MSGAITLRELGFEADGIVAGLTCDSREVKEGYIFAALPGSQNDGRDYIEKAIKAGAIAVLSTPGLILSVPYLASVLPRLPYAQMASKIHAGQPDTMVTVTGTNGKSSTVEFLRQIWTHAGLAAASIGTLGVYSPAGYKAMTHTTPDAVVLHEALAALAQEGVTHAAMEASSHGLDQFRLDAVKISASGFTNLSQDHFDYHGSIENYFQTKARLFIELTPSNAPVIINVDDEYGRELAQLCEEQGQKVIQVGWQGRDIQIKSLTPQPSSQLMAITLDGKEYKIDLPLVGEFQAFNVVTALGLALATGVPQQAGLSALKSLTGVSGRMELAGHAPSGAPIFVDFAHSEAGLETLLRSLRPHTDGDIVIAFGCGGDRDTGKRVKMGRAAARLADKVIVTDENPRSEVPELIRQAVLEGCSDAIEIGDRAAAIKAGIEGLGPKDCFVIAGKGHEQGQIIGDKVIPFSDVAEVQKVLKGLANA